MNRPTSLNLVLWLAMGFLLGSGGHCPARAQGGNQVLQVADTPDGVWRIELADYFQADRFELFSTNIASGQRRKIGKFTGPGEDVRLGFVISADSRYVVFTQGHETLDTDRKLYSAETNWWGWFTLSQPMVEGGGVKPSFKLLSDGVHVRYWADVFVDQEFAWYIVPAGGGLIFAEVFADGFEHGNAGRWR